MNPNQQMIEFINLRNILLKKPRIDPIEPIGRLRRTLREPRTRSTRYHSITSGQITPVRSSMLIHHVSEKLIRACVKGAPYGLKGGRREGVLHTIQLEKKAYSTSLQPPPSQTLYLNRFFSPPTPNSSICRDERLAPARRFRSHLHIKFAERTEAAHNPAVRNSSRVINVRQTLLVNAKALAGTELSREALAPSDGLAELENPALQILVIIKCTNRPNTPPHVPQSIVRPKGHPPDLGRNVPRGDSSSIRRLPGSPPYIIIVMKRSIRTFGEEGVLRKILALSRSFTQWPPTPPGSQASTGIQQTACMKGSQ